MSTRNALAIITSFVFVLLCVACVAYAHEEDANHVYGPPQNLIISGGLEFPERKGDQEPYIEIAFDLPEGIPYSEIYEINFHFERQDGVKFPSDYTGGGFRYAVLARGHMMKSDEVERISDYNMLGCNFEGWDQARPRFVLRFTNSCMNRFPTRWYGRPPRGLLAMGARFDVLVGVTFIHLSERPDGKLGRDQHHYWARWRSVTIPTPADLVSKPTPTPTPPVVVDPGKDLAGRVEDLEYRIQMLCGEQKDME